MYGNERDHKIDGQLLCNDKDFGMNFYDEKIGAIGSEDLFTFKEEL